jgi:hypothetical protein
MTREQTTRWRQANLKKQKRGVRNDEKEIDRGMKQP